MNDDMHRPTEASLSSLSQDLVAAEASLAEEGWPERMIAIMRRAGCFAMVVPDVHGGLGASSQQRLMQYEAVAAGSLTSALVLTQHDAAGELLANTTNAGLADRILPGCAAGKTLLTVGISQLTTSRRGGTAPALVAIDSGDGFVLEGCMPWVTSAARADQVVTGAVLDNGRQILACVPLSAEGITIGQPARLLALTGSGTSEVRCTSVRVNTSQIVRGPIHDVLQRRAPVKSLTVTFVGLGVARALLALIDEYGNNARDCADAIATARTRMAAVRERAYGFAEQSDHSDAGIHRVALRGEVNDLVGRLAKTLMVLAKGTGYLAGHRAERLLREAMFLLVWSAPPSVQAETLNRIWM
ncbi:MAG: acyl-CoA dehydrogenase family protein [Phycisphaerae bacterium]